MTKKELLEAIKDMLLKVRRYFCRCDYLHLIAEHHFGGCNFYELECIKCGKIYIKKM